MIGIILMGVLVVFVIAVLCCLMVGLRPGAEKGRQVEVRVRSCEQKGEEENRLYYEMEVEFYGANGETLVRTMQSGKKYVPGEVIRCRYLEEAGLLFEEMTPEVRTKSRKNVLLFLVIVLIFVGIAAAMMFGDGLPEGSNMLIGYFVSILFMAVGVFGIYNKNQMKHKMQDMISLSGTQVDCAISHSMDEAGRTLLIYSPVYEYEWGGERRRIVGPMGSSGKKYRAIGRKVHILVDPHTGKAVCPEDEKTRGNFYLLFGVVGLLVLILLLAINFGVLS